MRTPVNGRPSYVRLLLGRFAELGEAEAFRGPAGSMTFEQARALVVRLASALHAHGVGRGDGVAVLAGNRPETTLLQFALHLLGARAVWLSTGVAAAEQAAFLRLAGVSAFVYDTERFAARGASLCAHLPRAHVLTLGESTHPDLLEAAARAPELPSDAVGEAGDVRTVFYTGGTTGRPKLVLHGHGFYETVRRMAAMSRGNAHRHLACLPVGHASGQLGILLALLRGGTVVTMPEFTADSVLAAIERNRINSTFLMPPLLYELLDHPASAHTDLSTLRCVTYGGSCTATARLEQALNLLGPVLQQIYGSVETGMVAALGPAGHDPAIPGRLSSCGRPLPFVNVRICDDGGHEQPAGKPGEIRVRGPMVMWGYWNAAGVEPASPDGWFRTGDVGFLDHDGFLHVVDRIKDVVITGRHATTVYSRLVEDVLLAHPRVRQAAVVGYPDDRLGEVIRAFVVAAEDPDLARRLRLLVRERLGALYEPAFVDFVDRLPLTALGKVDKRACRRSPVTDPRARRWPGAMAARSARPE
ncbi:fatty-acyl-CoA synthase [Amycolatopsis bartoniae]|uniref:Fatty acid CoA ligase n=1 Tax=Amycolatopsis bartoniae TaxID=941986 RepID=A0A8H9IXF3_9PSEU|nr:AMP-binding protein [Amycolatopsis bartoniae]MBB2939480.1 fatty-acyl-CoA synthase [Amycolatopsis bartoniae]TVT11317.1 AMP-binding protein [Amycolatopsis bartoniae]GHF66579.1 fatty acid CoA ligase [Amycolatopsis bartoniae]